ncbi:MAG: glycerol kinase GlpK [Chlorobi bacterium]|nr:glycerol kinase GlpK [Chlorobiota bacterium]
MSKEFILSLDQGTSSSRAILFDSKRNIVGVEQQEFNQYYPKAGWVEQGPLEIWESQFFVARQLIEKSGIQPDKIASIGITNQRETTILWEKSSGKPVFNAIVWQDKRTSDFCTKLKEEGWQDYIRENTGLVIDSYFSATKIHWILKNNPELLKKAKNGEILFGTVDTWLVWNLTKGEKHITDYSNASRTMLYNINKLDWDEKLLELFDIPKIMLPQVYPSSFENVETNESIFGISIPIGGIAGDQQAALFGQMCFEPGNAKNTYGTGCFMLMNTGEKPVISKHGLLTTIAWGVNNKVEYALEGSVFIAGAAIKWLRDALKMIKSASETEKIAENLANNGGVYVVPAFSGLGAPHWDMYARGAIFGLTQGSTNEHIIRATLESLAYQTKDVLNAMEKDSNIRLKNLNVDGGASANNFLMQFQSDILNVEVTRPKIIETTALGAALLAGLSAGFWTKEELLSTRKIEKVFKPEMNNETREKLFKGWQKAVERVGNWIE